MSSLPATFQQVSYIVDRVFAEYLYPATQQPTRLILAADITAAATTLTYTDTMIVPEELELLSNGTIIEIGGEQIIVGDVDEANDTLSSLVRGANGTVAKSHSADDIIIVAPTWPRKVVFDAVSDSISELWPRLYKVTVEVGVTLNDDFGKLPAATREVLAVYDTKNDYLPVDYQFLNYTRAYPTGKSVLVTATEGPVDVKIKARPQRPYNESDILEEIYVDDSWISAIVIGTMISIMSTPDMEAILTDYLTQRLKAESVRVGLGASLREGFIQLYEYRMARLVQARDVDENYEQSIQQWSVV